MRAIRRKRLADGALERALAEEGSIEFGGRIVCARRVQKPIKGFGVVYRDDGDEEAKKQWLMLVDERRGLGAIFEPQVRIGFDGITYSHLEAEAKCGRGVFRDSDGHWRIDDLDLPRSARRWDGQAPAILKDRAC